MVQALSVKIEAFSSAGTKFEFGFDFHSWVDDDGAAGGILPEWTQ